ncbi:DUF3486 family protein [Citrobacter braakii]|uniref:DUF3486 family protein n=1 Tax=Citrobacter braakii TaxID=57706 RepID=UPI00403A60B3
MAEKRTRGRVSKVDLLPQSIQRELNNLLADKKNTQQDIRAAINELIDEHGLPPKMKLSRSGLNRYAVDMETAGSKIREMNAIAEQWTNKIDIEKSGETSKLLIQIVRSLAFDVVLKMQNGDGKIDPKGLRELSVAIEKLEKAATESNKREQEIRRQMALEAADAAEDAAKSAGLSAEGAAVIRKQILGLA